MVRRGSWKRRNPGVPAPDFAAVAAAAEAGAAAAAGRSAGPLGEDDEAAAKTLQSLSVSATSRPAGSGGAQPAVSTGRQRRRASDARTASTAARGGACLQRSGSEVKRVGALDIMATAADLRCANSLPKH